MEREGDKTQTHRSNGRWARLAPLILLILYIGYNEARKVMANPSPNSPDYIAPNTSSPKVLSEPAIRTIPNEYNAQSIALPETASFAGEPVPLNIPDVRERLDRELHINTYWHNNTIFLIKRANRWLPQIEKILAENGIPDDFKYLCVIESGLENVVSGKRAAGFWQLLPGTAKELGLEVNREVDERYHPIKATHAAVKYLKKSYEKFGNWTNVAASYNRGRAGYQRAIKDQKEDNYYKLLLNNETSRYLFRILACKEILSDPAKFGFDIAPEHLYEPYEFKEVKVTRTIRNMVDWAQDHGIDYKTLKKFNPWLRKKKLTVKRNTYYFSLPANLDSQ